MTIWPDCWTTKSLPEPSLAEVICTGVLIPAATWLSLSTGQSIWARERGAAERQKTRDNHHHGTGLLYFMGANLTVGVLAEACKWKIMVGYKGVIPGGERSHDDLHPETQAKTCGQKDARFMCGKKKAGRDVFHRVPLLFSRSI